MLLYCLLSALLQRFCAWAPTAVQRASFGVPASPPAPYPRHAVVAAPPFNRTAALPAFTFRGRNATAPPPPLLRVTLPCAMCVADADTAACADCPLAPFARYGRALRERRDVARLVISHHHHRSSAGGALHDSLCC